jgi:hypothetical protein
MPISCGDGKSGRVSVLFFLNLIESARPEIGPPEILRIAPPLALDRMDS